MLRKVGPFAVEGVHPDTVAEQGPAAAAPGRVDGDHGDAELVLLVDAEAPHQLVGQRGLAGAAGAGDAEHGDHPLGGRLLEPGPQVVGEPAGLGPGHGPRHRQPVAGDDRVGVASCCAQRSTSQSRIIVLIIPTRPSFWPSSGLKMRDAATPAALDLVVDDHAAAAAVHLDVAGPALAQGLHEVAEVLHVAALVGRDRDGVDVLLDGGVDDLVTLRLWPRWITSAPCACRILRMMLIEASWPSKSSTRSTTRTGCSGWWRSLTGLPRIVARGSGDSVGRPR